MDPATLGGIVVAIGSLIVMAVMEGANPMGLLLPPPMILVFGGALGAAGGVPVLNHLQIAPPQR